MKTNNKMALDEFKDKHRDSRIQSHMLLGCNLTVNHPQSETFHIY